MSNRLEDLDGLRGIGAFTVYLSHFLLCFYPGFFSSELPNTPMIFNLSTIVINTPLNIFINGKFAVAIFFVLSGFVLSYGFFKSSDYEKIRSSAFRRYFRLAIPILAMNIISYLLLKSGLYWNLEATKDIFRSYKLLGLYFQMEPDFIKAFTEATYNTFFTGIETIGQSYNSVIWTIFYEFWGSIIVYGFLFISGTFKTRWIVYVFLCLLNYNNYYLAFVFGIILADINVNIKISPNLLASILLFIFGIWFGSCSFLPVSLKIFPPYHLLEIINDSQIFWQTIGACLVVFVVKNRIEFSNIASIKVFNFLGKISFSLYLIHVPFICFFESWFIHTAIMKFHVYQPIAIMVCFIIGTILLLLLSIVFEKYIDSNGVKIGGLVLRKFQS